MRVTEGLGPTSLRNSHFVNNTATAVLRFEGRTWVLNTETFFAGIQFLDVLFYTQFQGASQAAYKFAELQQAQQQVSGVLIPLSARGPFVNKAGTIPPEMSAARWSTVVGPQCQILKCCWCCACCVAGKQRQGVI